jgi:hypothetical protein
MNRTKSSGSSLFSLVSLREKGKEAAKAALMKEQGDLSWPYECL